MCSTCGCSDGADVRSIDPDDQSALSAGGKPQRDHTHVPTHQPASDGEQGHEHHHDHGHDHNHDEYHHHDYDGHAHGQEVDAAGRHEGGRTIRLEQDLLAKNNLL